MPRRLLFVESNTTGTGMLALDITRRLGLEPVFLTGDPGRYRGLDDTGAEVVGCDTNDAGELLRAAARVPDVAGVTTTSEFYLQAVAEVAQAFGLPGNPPDVVRVCRDKAAVRRAMAARGVHQPRFAEVRSPGEVPAAVAHTGSPYVLKPVDDSGSVNVRICTEVAEGIVHAATILAVRTNVRGQPAAGAALVEQYVNGAEFSVEMFSAGGRAHCVGVTRKAVSPSPYCVETGHVYPADVDAATGEALVGAARAVLDATGVHFGPTHTELRLGPDGPVVIELNCRLAGGMIPELVRLSTGVDLIEQQLRCATGEPLRLPEMRTGRWAGIRFVTAPRRGVFAGVTGIEQARRHPGVVRAAVTMRPGTAVDRPRNAYDRIGYVIVAGDSPAGVADALAATSLIEPILR
ncbi:ATP-grasp domain-containing protein [Phytohabitans sp. LJ34]|uniref:ATP-grasp domain-containing protein n=1 Tax=Phytohabitans sp. LJ34 TaxID=3452217 RepID=UPI003F89EDF3